MRGVGRIAKLGVFTGRTLSADGLQIDGREDGVLRLGASGSSFLEQRNGGLAAARAMKDVDIQVRHGGSPVVATSICFATTVVVDQAANVARPLIVGCARKQQCQLIVMGTHRRSHATSGDVFAQ